MVAQKTLLYLRCLSLFAVLVSSVQQTNAKDTEDSKDPPLVSRYAESHIVAYAYTDFDEYLLAAGPSNADRKVPTHTLGGEIYPVIYRTATNQESLVTVSRNFEHVPDKAGVKKRFSCKNQACGPKFVPLLLTHHHKMKSERIGTVGVADFAPVANNNAESSRAQNRRVEMV